MTNLLDLPPNDQPEPDNGKTYVVLPCEPQHFKRFIVGLLGKPQEHKGSVEGVFQVKPRDIANIYHLINQRVTTQNNATLIHLSLTVHYSDGVSVTHNTIEAFEKYHPTNNSFSVAITASFSYLINFNGRLHPEKQEIEVMLSTDPDVLPEDGRHGGWFQSGVFSYRVVHTEITWATDIAGLLKNHAESIIDRSSKIKTFIGHNCDELMTYWFSIIFIGTMASWGYSALHIFEQNLIITVQSAVKYISLSLSVFLSLWVLLSSIRYFFERHVYLRTPSFILLTQNDVDHSEKTKRVLFRRWLAHFSGWVLGLASGVFSNHLYTLLTK